MDDRHCKVEAVSSEGDSTLQVPPHTTERRLKAKIDWHVLPPLVVTFLLSFLDKVNISNAAIFGLRRDLNLQGVQFNTCLAIFFVPYVILEVPANLLIKKLKPHVYLPTCMICFGLVSMCQGFVHNYHALLGVRFLLGIAEAGSFPGCFYIIAMWYKRSEAQRRFTFFYGSAAIAGSLGGLLASVIGKMNGVGGYAGWRWIFILEGLLTIIIAVIFFRIIPDFPEDAKFIDDRERAYILARLRADVGDNHAHEPITWAQIAHTFKDVKMLLASLIYFSLLVPGYGFAYFAPTIISQYGYSPIHTQLLSVAPWAAAFVASMLVAWASDAAQLRFAFIVPACCVAIAGFGMLLGVQEDVSTRYAALFVQVMGMWSALPIVVCWINMNLFGHAARSVGGAWVVGFGNAGGVVAVFLFLGEEGPYTLGYAVSIGFIVLALVLSCVYLWLCIRENRGLGGGGDKGAVVTDGESMVSARYRYML